MTSSIQMMQSNFIGTNLPISSVDPLSKVQSQVVRK